MATALFPFNEILNFAGCASHVLVNNNGAVTRAAPCVALPHLTSLNFHKPPNIYKEIHSLLQYHIILFLDHVYAKESRREQKVAVMTKDWG